MANVMMYCTAMCPYCVRAEQLLLRKGAEVTKVRVDLEPNRLQEMMTRSGGRRSVPQVFIDQFHVGGYDELAELDVAGKLEPLLQ